MSSRKKRQTAVEKKLREVNATQRSLKAASELQLDSKEEEALLQLLAKLDGIQIEERQPKDINSAYLDRDEEIFVPSKTSKNLTKDEYSYKLLRDDRRVRKEAYEGLTVSPEKIAARIRRTIAASHRSETLASTQQSNVTMSETLIALATAAEAAERNAASTGTMAPKLSSTVRVTFELDKGKKQKSAGKLVVLQRQTPLSELLATMRSKFNVGSKYNTFVIASVNKVLQEVDLVTLADGEVLRLTQEKDAPAVPVPVPTAIDAKPDKTKQKKAVKHAAEDVLFYEDSPSRDVIAPSETEMGDVKMTQDEEDQEPEIENNPEEEEDAWDVAKLTEEQRLTNPYYTAQQVASITPDADASSSMLAQYNHRLNNPQHQTHVLEGRRALPIASIRDELLSTIAAHQVVIVCGETGSGKTTQLPHYLLEDAIARNQGAECSIICTQPRRIAAISVAERVHYEASAFTSQDTSSTGRTGKNNRSIDGQGLIGYQVRLDAVATEKTRLLFCTTGVLLRKLQTPSFWETVSHLVLDEVHERGVETDFLLAILKQSLAAHPRVKVILMSATMQEHKFQEYFQHCPVLYVSGRTFPVTQHYLPDIETFIKQNSTANGAGGNNNNNKGNGNAKYVYQNNIIQQQQRAQGGAKGKSNAGKQKDTTADATVIPPTFDSELIADLVGAIIRHYHKENPRVVPGQPIGEDTPTRGQAILVFLSGLQAMEKVLKALRNRPFMRNYSGPTELAPMVCMLHGTMAPEQQRQVFRRTLPGQWKVVLATNIAETSITVDDVTHVIDSGFVKEQRFHPVSGLSVLEEVYIAQSNATQRSGRAGRVRPGHSWRLYSQHCMQSLSAVPTSTTSDNHNRNSNKNNTASQNDQLYRFAAYPLPEIQRIALEEVVLQVLLLQLGRPEVFLGHCLEPPTLPQLRAAIATLIEVKAVRAEAQLPLTALGFHLARLPLDVRLGKMLVYAALLQVTEPALTIAAYLSCRASPFLAPFDQRDIARKVHRQWFLEAEQDAAAHFIAANGGAASQNNNTNRNTNNNTASTASASATSASGKGTSALFTSRNCSTVASVATATSSTSDSDHVAVVRAYNAWHQVRTALGEGAAYRFCRGHFLSQTKLQEIARLRSQYARQLRKAGLLWSDAAQKDLKQKKDKKKRSMHAETTSNGDTLVDSGSDAFSDADSDVDSEDVDNSDDDDAIGATDVAVIAVERGKDADVDVLMTAAEEDILLRCALCAGLFPQIIRAVDVSVNGSSRFVRTPSGSQGQQDGVKKRTKLVQGDGQDVVLHPSSLLCGKAGSLVPETARDAFLVYYVKTAVSTGPPGVSVSLPGPQTTPSKAHSNPPNGSANAVRIQVFDATVVPHPALLLFAGNDIAIKKLPTSASSTDLSRRQQRRLANAQHYQQSTAHLTSHAQQRRCLRVQIAQWIEMELSEVHVACYRRLQREIETLLRCQVESALHFYPRESSTASATSSMVLRERQQVVRGAISILVRSFLPPEDDEEEEEEDEDGNAFDDDEEDEEEAEDEDEA